MLPDHPQQRPVALDADSAAESTGSAQVGVVQGEQIFSHPADANHPAADPASEFPASDLHAARPRGRRRRRAATGMRLLDSYYVKALAG
ncbi:hypothetical protein GCM10022221_26220 [Actinocorallia aurea]